MLNTVCCGCDRKSGRGGGESGRDLLPLSPQLYTRNIFIFDALPIEAGGGGIRN